MKRLCICLFILFFFSGVCSRNGTYLKQEKLVLNQTNQTNHTNNSNHSNYISKTNQTNQTNSTNSSILINDTEVPRNFFS